MDTNRLSRSELHRRSTTVDVNARYFWIASRAEARVCR